MITIDGAQGESGGQIFRSALTLSMCLKIPVRVINIRAGRHNPGLLRQHLTCLQAARQITRAEVSGAELGATEVTFSPGPVVPGEYEFAVGSAGSTTLIFQTILPALAQANAISEVRFSGGTHNKAAPSYDFLTLCYLPVLAAMGYRVETALETYGFYPNGGGSWRARIYPVAHPRRLDLTGRGPLLGRQALVTQARIAAHVAERELKQLQTDLDLQPTELGRRQVAAPSSGNIVSLRLRSEAVTEVIEVVGERGISAERIAARVSAAAMAYLASTAPVGEHLADQLLVPMILAGGGRFRTHMLSSHTQTNLAVLEQISGRTIAAIQLDSGDWHLTLD